MPAGYQDDGMCSGVDAGNMGENAGPSFSIGLTQMAKESLATSPAKVHPTDCYVVAIYSQWKIECTIPMFVCLHIPYIQCTSYGSQLPSLS